VNVGTDIGDFMLKNAHGIFSYQLANSIDDVDMGVTDVVRGADLMTVTAAHLLIQQAIGGHSIRYRHLPLALTSAGEKLSKATNAPEVEAKDASHTLQRAFLHLGLGTIELDASIHMLDEALSKWPHRK
jgi:glutamyl-Q tRNA(Asp) synthetase